MTDTNTTTGEQTDHSPLRLNTETWMGLLSYISGRLQKLEGQAELSRWRLIRCAAFARFPIQDDLRVQAIMTCLETGMLQCDPEIFSSDLNHIINSIEAGEARARAVTHG